MRTVLTAHLQALSADHLAEIVLCTCGGKATRYAEFKLPLGIEALQGKAHILHHAIDRSAATAAAFFSLSAGVHKVVLNDADHFVRFRL